MTTRTLAVAMVATGVMVSVVVAVGGCSDGAGPAPSPASGAEARPAARIAAGVERVRRAGSARFAAVLRIDVDGVTALRTTTAGAVDARGRRGRAGVEAQGALADDPALGAGGVEAIVTDAGTYLRRPALDPRWVALGPPAGADAERAWTEITGSPLLDPAVGLDVVAAVSPPVRDLGAARVRGVATRRYRARADLGALGALAGLARLGLDLDDRPVTIDVWLDGEGLVRRTVVAASDVLSGEPGAPDVDVVLDVQSWDHGRPVAVSAPPAATTVTPR